MIPGIPYRYAGVPSNGTSEVQRITIGGSPTSGTFRLQLGPYLTGPITFSTTNSTLVANIQAALRALRSINGAHVTVTVNSATAGVGTFDATFGGNLASLNMALMTVADNSLNGSGTIAVATQTAGVTATFRGSPTGTEVVNTETGDVYVNSGTNYAPVWTLSTGVYGYNTKKAPIGSPAVGSNTSVHAAIALTSSTQSVSTGFTNPDVPRNVVVKGNASGNAGNVVVNGTNANGDVISETIALNGSSAVAGNKAFKTVTSVDLPAETHAGTDTVSIGTGAKLGIGAKLALNTVLQAHFNGVLEGTAPTVAVSSSAIESNTAQLNSALNGSAVVLYYINDVTP